jgi:arylsulfatase A-like enzyme
MAVRRCFLSLFLLVVASSVVAFAASPQRPNVILITLDTTRADRMGFLGSQRGLTPNLDALANDSVSFVRAYSQAPLTPVSHAVILTGTYPQFNHVNDFGKPLTEDLPYLPDLLRKSGYTTGAFVGSLVLDAQFGLAPGFDRGFDVYNAGFRTHRPSEDRYKTVERRGAEVVERAIRWLETKRGPKPFFLWVHLYDAHDPYDPPEPFRSRYKTAPYDGEVAYEDDVVEKLLTALRRRGLYTNSIIAVTADHGEALGEHGESTHGIFLYDETIHVPLLFKLPQGKSSGRKISRRASLVDIAPTILQLAGAQIPRAMQGTVLVPQMVSRNALAGSQPAIKEDEGTSYAETDYPRRAFGWSALASLRSGKYLFIQSPRPELYADESDPQASKNLAAGRVAVADTLSGQVKEFKSKTSANRSAVPAKVDPQQAEKLGALGYVASDNSTSDKPAAGTQIDPKDKIEIANLMHDALLDVEDGRYTEAIPKLERALKEQPKMPIAQTQFGIALARSKQFERAVPELQKAVDQQPDSGMARYELGLALFETGKWTEAAPEFEAAVAKAPKWADAQFSLASVYARIDRVPEAMQRLDTCLELNPEHYRANLLRGRILSLQKRPQEALPNLEKAAAVQPESREAHLFLADAYAQLGRVMDAQRERARAGPAQ